MDNNDKIKSQSEIGIRIVLELSEIEARFLLKMTSWGTKPYKEWFVKHLSKYELKPLDKGVDSLFHTIQEELPKHLDKIDKAREILKK